MKIFKKVMFLSFTVLALVMSSCSSDNSSDDDSEQTSQEDFIKFKYNEKVYTFDPSVSTSLSLLVAGSSGIDNTYKRVSLWMPLNFTVGNHKVVYDLSQLTTTYQVTFSFLPEFDNADATSGNINITLINDKKIEGTFNFSGTKSGKTFTVTEGSFRVPRL